MEMMFSGGHGVEAHVIGHLGYIPYFLQHLLIFVVIATNRPQLFELLKSGGNGWQDKQVKFHGNFSSQLFSPDAQASGSYYQAWSARLPGGFSRLCEVSPELQLRAGA